MLLYVTPIVTTTEIPIRYTKENEKKTKHITTKKKVNETQRKKHKAREKRETKKGIRQTENDEQNGGIKYFPIAISDINGLNSQIQRHRVAKWTKKKKKSNYILPTRYVL